MSFIQFKYSKRQLYLTLGNVSVFLFIQDNIEFIGFNLAIINENMCLLQ